MMPRGAAVHERLTRIWQSPPGFYGWLAAVNHRVIGVRYVVTAFGFMVLAGILALVMRIQLAWPELQIVSPAAFNQIFTMHGTTMMFLFAVPVMEGIGIYLVPLMIGTRDMAFPRLNAFGYWIYLVAGVMLYVSFILGIAPDGGWFAYPPLTGPGFSPGPNVDFWVTMITFIEVAALVAAVELIVTVFKQRAPGMALHRLPLFVWAQVTMSFMIVFAMPVLMLCSVQLMLDRTIGTHFFNPGGGGEPLLWQHLFWIFGHPDVYIILLPALGIVSMVIPTAVRRPIVGYTWIAAATVAIGFFSFGLWAHHMYATGLTLLGLNFFAAVSMLIAIPSAVQIFAWIATIWRGRLERLTTAFLYVIGFIVLFILGGITGIMIGSPVFNWQVHDTYFIVAHFHYVLVGGAVFPLFAAFYFWFPKVTGRMLSERLGRWNFWLTFIGFNATFLPMHLTGFRGMPRRVYTYLAELDIGLLNLVSSLGAFVMAVGVLLFALNVAVSLLFGKRAAAALAYVGLASYDRVSLAVLQRKMARRFPAVRGTGRIFQVLADLSSVQPADGPTDLAAAARHYAAQLTQRGPLLLISDMFDANAERAISELAGTRCDVAVLHTLSSDELDPPFEGDLRLVDRETGEGVDITADLYTLDRYRQRLAEWQAHLEEVSTKRRVAYVPTPTTLPLADLVFAELRRRRVVAA